MKKTSRKQGATNRSCAVSTGSVFWVIDPETCGEHRGSATAHGPFPSMRAAELYLIRDAAETYLDADKSLRELEEGEHWAEPVIIAEVRRTVRQEPRAHVSVWLAECDTPNV